MHGLNLNHTVYFRNRAILHFSPHGTFGFLTIFLHDGLVSSLGQFLNFTR